MKTVLLSFFLLSNAVGFSQTIQELEANDLFGGIKARHIGPALMSGRVSDIEGHPTNKQVIYAGTAGGGVWRSNDGGVLFNSIFDEYCQSIGAVAIDPNDPDKTIWVGTGEVWTRNSVSIGDGIYKTTDGGKNWKKMGLENSDRISSIEINPANSNEIFVGVQGALWGPSADRGVYKTADGGETWEKIFFINENTGCSELIMDPTNSSILYASFWEHRRTAWSFNSGGESSALYKSVDGGKTWNKIHKGFPAGKFGRIAVSIAPSNSNILYAVVESEDASKSGMYKSIDGGQNWEHTNNDFGLVVRPFYFSRIVVHPTNSDIITKAGLFGSISKDGGKTFKNLGPMHPDIHDIWFDVNDPDKMFVATDGGLYRSMNLGETMEMVENLPISQFYHVAVDNQEPYNIYGGLQDNGSWFGPSSSPGGVESRDWEVIGVGDGFRVYPHPTNPDVMYSEMQGAETIWRYDNSMRQSKVITPYPVKGDPKLRYNWNAPITTSPNKPDRLYVGSQFVHRSEDRGDTWVKISPDLTTNNKAKQNQAASGGISTDNSGAENHCTIFTIAESPISEETIWVGTDDGNVQISQNGGNTWSNVTEQLNAVGLPKNTWCYHIEASVHHLGSAYAVFEGHTSNDKKAYCYKTEDFGKTWKSIVTDEIVGFARSFQEDRENENILFLGTEFGLYVSITGGTKWMKFDNNMPSVAIHYLEMHPKTNDLIMGTHGRGIIIIDDLSPLRQITNKTLSKELTFLEMPSFTMKEESTFGGTSTEIQFVGQNPESGARISYFLANRHTFGKMKMDVYDLENNFIAALSPEKKKGLNTVYWNFNATAPKTASGKSFAAGGMTVPRVSAGKYKIVIEKGKEQFTTTIDVEYTKKSVYTLEERKLQEKVTHDLYNMNEDLAYLVFEIDELLSHIEKAKIENSKIEKSAAKLASVLISLKEELVITTGDNYVGRAEDKLREDLGDIYSTIAGNFGPPTSSQLENVDLMKTKLNDANSKMQSIRNGDLKKYKDALAKLGMKEFTMIPFDEFVKKD